MSLYPDLPSIFVNKGTARNYLVNFAGARDTFNDVAGHDWSSFTWFRDPSDGLISLRFYPTKLDRLLHDQSAVHLAPVQINVADVNLANAKGIRVGFNSSVDDRLDFISFGSLTISRYFNDFRDFEPYTTCKLYVPYFGFIKVPLQPLYDSYFTYLKIAVDLYSGFANAYLIGSDSLGNKYIILQQGKKLGIDIPLSHSNSGFEQLELIQNIINSAVSTAKAATIYSIFAGPEGGAAMGMLTAASGINSALSSYESEYTVSGSFGSFAATYDPTSAYFEFERVNDLATAYAPVKGKPLGEYKLLSSLSGYTEITDINIPQQTNLTSEEIDELKSLLAGGVIL